MPHGGDEGEWRRGWVWRRPLLTEDVTWEETPSDKWNLEEREGVCVRREEWDEGEDENEEVSRFSY